VEEVSVTKQAVLEKAITKAIAGGWDKFGNPKYNYLLNTFTDTQGNADVEFKLVAFNDVSYYTINDIIYNHDFAKALWPTKEYSKDAGWQYHLQMMVVSNDPLAYLEANM
jgi:hypothetical protein